MQNEEWGTKITNYEFQITNMMQKGELRVILYHVFNDYF